MDLNKNTTLQYRSPEMVEPMLGWAVGLPSGQLPRNVTICQLMSRCLGAGSVAVQIMLLHHTIRGAWDAGHRQCEVYFSAIPSLLTQASAFDW